MATAVWRGHISFGLVSIPVCLYRAARSERVNLRELYAVRREPENPAPRIVRESDTLQNRREAPVEIAHEEPPEFVAPVRRVSVREGSAEPLERSAITKGYEVEKGRYVTIDPEELRSLVPKTATEMEIVEFVHIVEVDPVYFEASYYVSPDEAGQQAYALLFESMRQTGLVGLARFAMHRREHIVILRPGRSGIVSHTMFFESEVRAEQEYKADPSLVNPKNLELAKMLTESLAAKFDPTKYRDSYREKLEALIASKSQTDQTAATAAAPASNPRVADITEALRRSLAAAKKPVAAQPGAKKSRRRA
jgi:DNA end-binding protein Ku